MNIKTSKLAVASIILGILSIVLCPTIIISIPCGVLAIVFGVIAKKEISESNLSNKGLGIGGIATGSVGLFLTLILIIVIIVTLLNYSPFGKHGSFTYDGDFYNDFYEFDDRFDYYFPEIEE